MTAKQRFRMTLDILMTLCSVFLMGGPWLFAWNGVHEILGTLLLVLWAIHVVLNRRWYGSLFKGQYSAYRIMQAVVNVCILVCAVLLMVSGIMLSDYVFGFLPLEGGTAFARTAHLLASHWYFLFMSLHIGMHAGMIARNMRFSKGGLLAARVAVLCVALYGAFAFVRRGVWAYLILRQQFFFLDMIGGHALFVADYIAIIVMFAAAAHYAGKLAKR